MTKPETAQENEEPLIPEQTEQPEEALELTNEAEDPVKKLQEENGKLRDQMLRAMADAENVRKRAERDVEDAGKYAVGSFARDMINVLENLVRAEQNIPEDIAGDNAALKNFIEGIALTKKELVSAFEKHGIKRIDPLGEKFDHNFHQAVAQVESADKEPGTVISVVQAGYTIRDRLLRPAMVAVAKAPEA